MLILFGFPVAVVFGSIYITLTQLSRVFETVYGESVGIASLHYLSLALGYTVGGQLGGRALDARYRRAKEANGGVGTPEMKLFTMKVGSFIYPAGYLIWGFSVQHRVFWLVPDIGTFMLALGMRTIFLGIQSYLLDAFEVYAASAMASAIFLRSICGFAFPLFSTELFDALGYGWGSALLALIVALVGIPGPFLLTRYGPELRKRNILGKRI